MNGERVVERLTDKNYWEAHWDAKGVKGARRLDPDIVRLLLKFLPKSERMTLIEVGCASGRWLAFFHRVLRYQVSGIEYAERAAVRTRQHLRLLGVPTEIIVADFFEYVKGKQQYDVVFSGGFIEHFPDLPEVTAQLCALSHQFVVTIVPNLYGINGWISKSLRPKVYAAHVPIKRALLQNLHERSGMNTLFCNYVSGLKLIRPAWGSPFFENHPLISFALNIPPGLFNLTSELMSKTLHYWPRSSLLSPALLYIGSK